MLHVVVDMAVKDPEARVVKWGPENDISVGGYQNDMFENWVIEVAWEGLTSTLAVLVHPDDIFPGDIFRELALSNHVVPPAMLMDWVSDLSIAVDVYENDFKPLVRQCRLLEDMATVLRFQWDWGSQTVSLVF